MIFNLLNSLTDPDNIPDGFGGGFDLNNGGWAIIGVLLVIIFVLIFVIVYFVFKLDKYKGKEETKNTELTNNNLSEEEKQTITEFRKLTDQEKQIINDTIKTFNKPKNE
ncbi:MAG: hypothetical protein K2L12_02505 [Clostridia bacterium]|nr:hypothetical protein [Clostridia bacterium]